MEKLSRYSEIEKYLLSVPRFTKKSTPQDTADFYRILGSPGSRQHIIHVAGTNGKGSVCSYVSSLLSTCGFSNAMFTSPHLVQMTERIRLNGRCVDREEFVRAFDRVMDTVKQCNRHPTFFEFLFFMAMLIFEEAQTDYIILETGLGGRLDATNCIARPQICIITDIGLDHMEYLGSTVAEIAAEKAGIIKPGCPVVCKREKKEAFDVIAQTAAMQNSPIFAVDKSQIGILEKRKKAIDFSYKSRYYDYISLSVSTDALYQTENAALAIRAMEVMIPKSVLTQERIQKAVEHTHWEGRMEEVLPEIYVDGAHNEDGISAFLQSVEKDGFCGSRTLLYAAVKDKQYENMLAQLMQSGLFQRTVAAVLDTQRAVSKQELLRALHNCGQESVKCYNSVREALTALRAVRREDERIYAVGSLYLVGEIKAIVSEEG